LLPADKRAGTILVTGASGELGVYLCRHLDERGWTVLGLDKHAGLSPEGVTIRQCDLSVGQEVTLAVDALVAAHGPIDALINCAARIANAPLVTLGPEGWAVHDFSVWDDVIGSGLSSAFYTTAAVVRYMLQARRKGVVINISSICAHGNPGQAAYSAAKAGLNGLTYALAKELAPFGVRVAGLAPGYLDTHSTRTHVPEAKLTRIAASVPLRRLGTTAEVAHGVDFILANDYVNGTIIELTGGLVL
jgi:3-oxoacyl-[acyl-carrier protein] reductase